MSNKVTAQGFGYRQRRVLAYGDAVFPQERFDSLVQSLPSAVSSEEWQDLMRRITELFRS